MSHHRLPDPKGRPREIAIGLLILTVLAGVVVTRGGLPSATYAEDQPDPTVWIDEPGMSREGDASEPASPRRWRD